MPEKTITASKRPNHVKDLMLLFAVPASIAVIAAIAVYVPSLMAHPKYNFVYAVCMTYNCQNDYIVDADGHISRQFLASEVTNLSSPKQEPALRYYSTRTDSYRTITFAEAQAYQLDSSSKSHDGYTLQRADTSSGLLFWDNTDNGWYLKQGAKKHKVNLGQSSSYYSTEVTFLGWVNK